MATKCQATELLVGFYRRSAIIVEINKSRMGKDVLGLFKKSENNKFVCQVELCGAVISAGSGSTFNLERHIKRAHSEKTPKTKN